MILNLEKLNRILIIRLSSLGDILLTTPLIRSLKKANPDLKIDFLVRKEYEDTLKNNPHLNQLYQYKNENVDEIINQLLQNKYDLIIDLQNNLRSKKIANHLKASSVKFKKKSLEKFLLVNFKINFLKDVPQIPIRYANSLNNFQLDEFGLELFLPKEIKSSINFEENLIGFAPGSRHFTKMYPKEYFIELGKLLSQNFKILLFGGKSDREICAEISKQIPNSIDLSNDNNLFQTAADMKICKAIICNDSGMMHTACAVQVPVITIFGSTVKEFGFTPYKISNLILENNSLSCRPCSHIGREKCPEKHFKCMLEITPEIVHKKVLEFLRDLK